MSEGKRVLEVDPILGIQQNFVYHPDNDTVTIETLQNVTDIVADAKGEHRLYDERTPWVTKGMAMNHFARIPMVIYYDLLRRGILRDQEALKKWANDPDNAVFRTRPGKV